MTEDELPVADDLPAAMVTRPQWVCWRAEARGEKTTKIPVNPSTGRYASTTDPETWTDFATAREYSVAKGTGLGFVFTDDDPLVGVDLDDCRGVESGSLTDWADDIVARLDSFTEISPSGTGVHVIVKGILPEGRNRHGDVELYETARFFTVTGDHLDGTPETAKARSEALAAVHEAYVAPSSETDSGSSGEPEREPSASNPPEGSTELQDEELLRKARNAANGEKFDRLYRGETGGYASHSEADMALCSMLAFWTGGDARQMDRLFRGSGLLREKWDEVHFADGATYGERTTERAIAGTDAFYDGGGEWSLFPEQAEETVAGHDPPSEDSRRSVDSEVVEQLVAEIRQLEAVNEQLAEELEAERNRRETLEEELAAVETSGWLSWIWN
ncbi:phage NrS-1 polymerase family protein [Natronomonas sp. EA1]|uniref:phage NrS-1 polymerase family protein n=1 Tax=Natronomonas sp. EA1 TaxID=3421655 RepID=UPI003EC12817